MDSTTKKILIIVAVVVVVIAAAYASGFFNSSDSQPVNRPTNPPNRRNPSPPDSSDPLREYRQKKAKLEEEARKQKIEREAKQKAEEKKQQDFKANDKTKAEAAIKASQDLKSVLEKQKTAFDNLSRMPKYDLQQKLVNPEQILFKNVKNSCPALTVFFDNGVFDEEAVSQKVIAFGANLGDSATKKFLDSTCNSLRTNPMLWGSNQSLAMDNSLLVHNNGLTLSNILKKFSSGRYSEACINEYLTKVNAALSNDFVELLGKIYASSP